jgi:hypothetical protein
MADSEEKTIHFTEAEFQRVLDNWKASMTPQLIQAAKDTAANILETYADAIGKADVKASTPESRIEVEAALSQAAEMARGMATQLRNAPDE